MAIREQVVPAVHNASVHAPTATDVVPRMELAEQFNIDTNAAMEYVNVVGKERSRPVIAV